MFLWAKEFCDLISILCVKCGTKPFLHDCTEIDYKGQNQIKINIRNKTSKPKASSKICVEEKI
jgi:hypothetical protein